MVAFRECVAGMWINVAKKKRGISSSLFQLAILCFV